MATTYRDALNRVLRVLGEDAIASGESDLTSDYLIMVGEFFNQIKEEVEDAQPWRSMWGVLTATVAADVRNGDITNSTDRSRLIRIHDNHRQRLVPLVFDTTDADNPVPLEETTLADLRFRDAQSPNVRASGAPQLFAIDEGDEDTTGLRIAVHPRPSVQRTISLTMATPQARLEPEGDLDTNILVPVSPIVVGTLWYALEERGEELGPTSLFSEERFQIALTSAVARDVADQGGLELVVQ